MSIVSTSPLMMLRTGSVGGQSSTRSWDVTMPSSRPSSMTGIPWMPKANMRSRARSTGSDGFKLKGS